MRTVRFLIWLTALNVMGSMMLPAAQVNSMLPLTARPRFGGGEKARADMTAELLAMKRSDPLTACIVSVDMKSKIKMWKWIHPRMRDVRSEREVPKGLKTRRR